ncbi:MAG: hypothetical protein Q7S12_03190 [bacterium]|nr:hypothetical protein [bacterium]
MIKSALLSILTILLFATQAFSKPYSSMLPKDFETAPKKLTCERDQPTSIYMKLYTHEKEKWTAELYGKNKKDQILLFGKLERDEKTNTDGKLFIFFMTPSGWKEANELSNELSDEENIKFIKTIPEYTKEEEIFFDECAKQGKWAD